MAVRRVFVKKGKRKTTIDQSINRLMFVAYAGKTAPGRAAERSPPVGPVGGKGRCVPPRGLPSPPRQVPEHRLRRAPGEGAVSPGQEHAVQDVSGALGVDDG